MTTVYSCYQNRNDLLAPLRARLPDNATRIGFIAGDNDSDYSLWRPLGCRQVVCLWNGTPQTSILTPPDVEWIVRQTQRLAASSPGCLWKPGRLSIGWILCFRFRSGHLLTRVRKPVPAAYLKTVIEAGQRAQPLASSQRWNIFQPPAFALFAFSAVKHSCDSCLSRLKTHKILLVLVLVLEPYNPRSSRRESALNLIPKSCQRTSPGLCPPP